MTTQSQIKKWQLFEIKHKELLLYGIKNELIKPYDNALIEKLRKIYYGGIPASIILLSDNLSNGYCYDRALLLAEAFISEEDDINLIYAEVDSLTLNPKYDIKNNPELKEHCILERITKDGKHLIYDTSEGLIFDKDIYWKMENPKVHMVRTKRQIKEFLENDDQMTPESLKNDRYVAIMIMPLLEMTYDNHTEMYASKGIELLQREIEHFKKLIDYEELQKETFKDMKRLGINPIGDKNKK